MPLTYLAFCADKEERYVRYATARIGAERAQLLVQITFGDLAMSWPQVLRSVSPAAVSWGLLAARTAQMRGNIPGAPYDILSRQCADALVLRYRLGLSCTAAADLMGVAQPVLCALVQAGLRALR
jgi:hypothetical protein